MKSGFYKKQLDLFLCWKKHLSFEYSRKCRGVWVIERIRGYVEYVCSMNVCQLDCVAKKWQSRLMTMINYISTTMSSTARVHTGINSPGTLKFPLLSSSLNLATVFWSQRWWHTNKQPYRFIVKFANLIFLGSS